MLELYPKQVKHVVKNFPLRSHRYARKAAAAALAAHEQGKFWDYHKLLFQNYRSINDKKIQELAKVVGLNLDKFQADMGSPDIQALITRDIQEGRKNGVRGTPSIFINGRRLKKWKLEDFRRVIDEELRRQAAGNRSTQPKSSRGIPWIGSSS